MAIKVSGTTIIDDSRNVANVNTTTAVTFIGDGSQLTGIPLPPAVARPINVSPANGATGVTGTPTLTGSTYLSLYGKTKAAAQWQISTVSDFSTTVLNTGDVAGTAITYPVASGTINVSTLYYWRVRYKDADGAYSDWSTATTFTTAASFGPTTFGQTYCGGYYMGVLCGYYILVAPNATGCACCIWKNTQTATSGTASLTNGYANTYTALANTTHPAGNFTATRTINGFSDWYLPAIDELQQIYNNRGALPAGESYSLDFYWSSTEGSAARACYQSFLNGSRYTFNKTDSHRTRAVRREPI